MPKPTCKHCGSTESLFWQNHEGRQVCNECYALGKETRPETRSMGGRRAESGPARATGRGARRSTRVARQKAPPPPAPRGRGRRSATKRVPLRAPSATATLVTSDSIFFKGSYMQVGDIVSMIDVEGGTYYAQIRGFLTDQYCEKSAVVTWLLPTKASPPPEKCFDPATYIIGPEEELPRKLECMEFVMHAPSDYYHARTPYPPVAGAGGASALDNCSGFVWTSMEPKDRTKQ